MRLQLRLKILYSKQHTLYCNNQYKVMGWNFSIAVTSIRPIRNHCLVPVTYFFIYLGFRSHQDFRWKFCLSSANVGKNFTVFLYFLFNAVFLILSFAYGSLDYSFLVSCNLPFYIFIDFLVRLHVQEYGKPNYT